MTTPPRDFAADADEIGRLYADLVKSTLAERDIEGFCKLVAAHGAVVDLIDTLANTDSIIRGQEEEEQ